MVEFLNLPSEGERDVLRKELDEKTTELSTVLNRVITFEEVAEAILQGFQKAWSITLEVVNMIDEESKVNI
jgi:lipoate-protein ligase A